MGDECGDVEGDRDGDRWLAWEGILGSIRTDQSSETYPIGFFQASTTIILSSKCLLLLLSLVVSFSRGLPLIKSGSPDGTLVPSTVLPTPGLGIILVLKR